MAWQRRLRRLGPLVAVVVFAAACWQLSEELKNYRWSDFQQSLHDIPWRQFLFALAMVVADYTILVGNDWVASRIVGRQVSIGKLAVASVAGYAASHNFGAALSGTSVRYRFYSSWGLSAAEIAEWIALLATSFVLGVALVAGTVFLIEPLELPRDLSLRASNLRLLGAAGASVVGVYLAVCTWARTEKVPRWTLALPSPRLATLQVLIASADLLAASSIFYVLLPPESRGSYPHYLGIYLLALVAGVSSHVPGGLGVFDLVMIKLLVHGDRHDILAALTVYRILYYVLPLAVGTLLFASNEIQLRRQSVTVSDARTDKGGL